MNQAKHRITAFALALAVLLGGMIWQGPMTLQVQAADNADEMQEGTWTGMGRRYIEFGRDNNGDPILWRVLEVTDSGGGKTAFLLADDFVDTKRFHNSLNNNWESSEIYAWLNGTTSGTFLFDQFSTDEQDAILTSSYTYGNGNTTTASSKIFLLSVEEAENASYFADDEDRAMSATWWLRSPGNSTDKAAYVTLDGVVSPSGRDVGSSNGIRPALKIDLSSSIFTSYEILYDVQITVRDGQSNGIAGARISLSGASAPDAIFFTGADGVGRCPVPAGSYSVTVDKAGYAVQTETIVIGGGNTRHTITLTADDSLPDTVYFGQYNSSSLAWRVLEIDGDKALLLTDAVVGSAASWNDIDTWINSGYGFLDTANFTVAEQTAMLQSEYPTGNTVFLLSYNEVLRYLPNKTARSGATQDWWLRTPETTSGYYRYVSSSGTIYSGLAVNPRYARPAVWVDLSALCLSMSGGDTTLVPAFTATVTVEDNGKNPVAEATVTITPTAGETLRGWDGSDILSGITASGGAADFKLPEGTYNINVTGPSGYQDGSGTLTVGSSGGAETITLSLNNSPTPKSDLTRIVAKGGNATFTADDIAEDADVGDTLTITAIADHPDSGIATATINNGVVTVIGVDSGDTSVKVTVSDGGNFVDITVPIKVTDVPSVSINNLTVTVGETADFTVNLGDGANAATSATISSSDTTIATATPTDLTLSLGQSGTVTVKGEKAGQAIISIGYSGGSRNNEEDEVRVTVTDAAQVRVDFDPQGGEPPTPNSIDVVVGGTYPALPTVTRSGHTFEGWYTAASGGSKVTQGDTVTNSSDHTLYAQWSGDGGGGTNPGDNRQLTMGMLSNDTALVGRQYEKTVSITYTGSHTITFTQSGDALPSGLYFDSGSGRISGTPQTEGTYHITIRAEESGAASPLSASRSFTLTVTNIYTDPVLKLAPLDNDTVTVGEPYRKTLSVTYDGTDTLAYSATGLAPSLDINGTSGEISGTPTTEGRYTVHITVTDGTLMAQGSYTLTVNSSGGTPPPTTPSGGSTRGSSSGGSSTPDSRAAKTQLPASAFSWDGRTLTIDHDSITPLGLLSVQWDGQPLTRGTEYSVYQGSVIVRFGEDFMAAQAPGDHTIKVEFLNHTGETTVTVGETGLAEETAPPADNNTYNPNTGGDGAGSTGATDNPNTGNGRDVWPALLLGSLSAAALVRFRRGSGTPITMTVEDTGRLSNDVHRDDRIGPCVSCVQRHQRQPADRRLCQRRP